MHTSSPQTTHHASTSHEGPPVMFLRNEFSTVHSSSEKLILSSVVESGESRFRVGVSWDLPTSADLLTSGHIAAGGGANVLLIVYRLQLRLLLEVLPFVSSFNRGILGGSVLMNFELSPPPYSLPVWSNDEFQLSRLSAVTLRSTSVVKFIPPPTNDGGHSARDDARVTFGGGSSRGAAKFNSRRLPLASWSGRGVIILVDSRQFPAPPDGLESGVRTVLTPQEVVGWAPKSGCSCLSASGMKREKDLRSLSSREVGVNQMLSDCRFIVERLSEDGSRRPLSGDSSHGPRAVPFGNDWSKTVVWRKLIGRKHPFNWQPDNPGT